MPFVLVLNPMRGRAEATLPVAWADTREALEKFVTEQRVEPYQDGEWQKVFRAGGPLEWFNPPYDSELKVPGVFGHGIAEWMTEEQWLRHQAIVYAHKFQEMIKVD